MHRFLEPNVNKTQIQFDAILIMWCACMDPNYARYIYVWPNILHPTDIYNGQEGIGVDRMWTPTSSMFGVMGESPTWAKIIILHVFRSLWALICVYMDGRKVVLTFFS